MGNNDAKEYFINLNTKKIHYAKSMDKRCQAKKMKQDSIIYFDTLLQAQEYPSAVEPLANLCTICKNKYIKE